MLRRSEIAAATLLLLASSSLAQAADILPAGGTIDKALGVDITPQGLDFMLGQGVKLIPPEIQIPDTTGSQSFGICTVNYNAYPGQPTPGLPSNGIKVTIGTTSIIPRDGQCRPVHTQDRRSKRSTHVQLDDIFLLTAEVPHPHRPVLPAADDRLAIGREADAADRPCRAVVRRRPGILLGSEDGSLL